MDSRKKPRNPKTDSARVEIDMSSLLETTSIRPVEKAFELLDWKTPVAHDGFCRLMTHTDPGSSLVHACLNAICIPYRTGKLFNQDIGQIEFAHMFRKELALLLNEEVPGTDKLYVELIGNGSWVAMESTNMNTLAAQLHISTIEFDPVMIEHLSNAIDKNIYIINAETQDVEVDSIDIETRYKKDRSAVVVLRVKNHYELTCLRRFSGEYVTHFASSHPWIVTLDSIIKSKVAQAH
jgi:hypothetical protein